MNRVRSIARAAAVLLALAVAVAMALGGCSPGDAGSGEGGTGASVEATPIAQLAKVQVTEYKGKKLSSIEDFRENSIKGPQVVDLDTYTLRIRGEVESETVLTYDQVVAYPTYQKNVVLNCVEGWSADILWRGVRLRDLIDEAGAEPTANTVIFHCYDGYSTSLPLDTVVNKNLLLAYEMNGVLLPSERGFPFQVVAEDKLGYKWAKWVTEIELSSDDGYRGYWEERGYDNKANVR